MNFASLQENVPRALPRSFYARGAEVVARDLLGNAGESARPGAGQAVLLRAAEPLDGWDVDLRGPALLARAFGITGKDDHADLATGPVRITTGPAPKEIRADRRIGVDYAADWAH